MPDDTADLVRRLLIKNELRALPECLEAATALERLEREFTALGHLYAEAKTRNERLERVNSELRAKIRELEAPVR